MLVITLYVNRPVGDDARRESLFDGNIYLHTGVPAADALAEHAKDLISEAFRGFRSPAGAVRDERAGIRSTALPR